MPRGIKKVTSPPLQPPVQRGVIDTTDQLSENGWLDLEGKLHQCEWSDHDQAAKIHLTPEEFLDDGNPFTDTATEILEKKGWIKIQKCKPQEPDHVYHNGDDEWYVTADQYFFISDYMAHHKAKCMAYLNLRIRG